jgi:hypothetical protein
MQSVPITTDVVCSNLDQGEVSYIVSVLLVEETGENHRSVPSQNSIKIKLKIKIKALSHNVVHLALIEIRTNNISGELVFKILN